ncbi:MAG TPA: hypothetical protein PLZ08_10050 [Bacillota bacterium]|jgi:LEA14-like dessication related protein|nr:hypothetical protein [Bacillota bacterium]HOL10577.1 hypothetical protein [Bacillota bacterium]HPO98279.1 hypothetical protein [Bacillota bacterium]
MKSIKFYKAILFALLLWSNSALAMNDWSLWRGYGVVTVTGEEQYQAVELPERCYRYCNEDLSDLRIVDRNNKIVPYFIDNHGKNHIIKVTELQYQVENQADQSIITIDNENCLKINEIKLEIDGNYRRHYTISGANRGISFNGEIYNIKFKDVALNSSTINFNDCTLNDPQIKLIIYNQDDLPLTIKNIEVKYHVDRVIFDKSSGLQPFLIYFGNRSATKPVYDLEKFREYVVKEKISKAVITDIQLNEQIPDVKVKNNQGHEQYFNLVLIIITLILVAFIIIKLNNEQTKD